VLVAVIASYLQSGSREWHPSGGSQRTNFNYANVVTPFQTASKFAKSYKSTLLLINNRDCNFTVFFARL